MEQVKNKRIIIPGLMFGAAFILIIGVLMNPIASVKAVGGQVQAMPLVAISKGPNSNPAVLDAHRRLALGMLETGNRDDEIGGRGEISRYQIMPSVWRQYSHSLNYRNPDVSFAVAQKHWAHLYTGFIRQTHREPTDFDMYVLWNTHYGYYASKGFEPARLSPSVRDRAQRFVNLVQCNDL